MDHHGSRTWYRLLLPTADAKPPRQDGFAGRPSIAVLPFANLSGDPAQEYFADGCPRNHRRTIRNRSLLVIARNSSFSFRGRNVDVRTIARELGVRYVVDGSVQRNAERVRVGAELIDMTGGSNIWTERYDRGLADIFVLQDAIAAAVAVAIGPAIADAELRRAIRKPPAQLDAWEAHQRGLWHWAKGGEIENAQAREFFQRAIELDPMFASPRAMLGFVYFGRFPSGSHKLSGNMLRQPSTRRVSQSNWTPTTPRRLPSGHGSPSTKTN